jgi:hypothetical protein
MPYNASARRYVGSSTPYASISYGDAASQNLVLTNKALLTSTAMANVAALSALEEQLCYASPSGAARYKLLADVYAITAAYLIENG